MKTVHWSTMLSLICLTWVLLSSVSCILFIFGCTTSIATPKGKGITSSAHKILVTPPNLNEGNCKQRNSHCATLQKKIPCSMCEMPFCRCTDTMGRRKKRKKHVSLKITP